MKILALYTQRTLPLLRRVLAPYGALAARGHPFSSMQVSNFEDGVGLSYGHDLTVLPDWVLTQAEIESLQTLVHGAQRTFAYDLSDISLLQDERVRQTLPLCQLVTVPNEYMKREVSLLKTGARVVITPSVLDIEYFMSGRLTRLGDVPIHGGVTIGCFGAHDWDLVREPLARLKGSHPHTLILGDEQAVSVLGDVVTPVRLNLDTYPALVNACTFGLCPYEGARGQETIWLHEYGILYKPVIASSGSPYPKELGSSKVQYAPQFVSNQMPDRWLDAMLLWMRRPELRARGATESFQRANEQRATRRCETYLRVLGQSLPQLAFVV